MAAKAFLAVELLRSAIADFRTCLNKPETEQRNEVHWNDEKRLHKLFVRIPNQYRECNFYCQVGIFLQRTLDNQGSYDASRTVESSVEIACLLQARWQWTHTPIPSLTHTRATTQSAMFFLHDSGLFGRHDFLEASVQQEIIDDLERTGHKKWCTHEGGICEEYSSECW